MSVVDLTTGNVTRTIDVGDEPTDVLFAGAGRELAFVCVSGGPSRSAGDTGTGTGWGRVKVFDPANPAAALFTIGIPAKQPRALARDAEGGASSSPSSSRATGRPSCPSQS